MLGTSTCLICVLNIVKYDEKLLILSNIINTSQFLILKEN